MKNYRKWLPFLAIAGALLLVTMYFEQTYRRAYGNGDSSYRMVYIPKIKDDTNDFWTSLIEGAEMAADEYQVDLQIFAPKSEDDYERQKEFILAAIEQKPDVILLSPSRYVEITETAKQVKEAGIKLVLIDSDINEDIQDATIATDNVAAGAKMGQYAVQNLIDENTVIGIVGHVETSSTAIQRIEGLEKGLGTYADRIVDTVYCNSDYDRAYEVTTELLTEHQEINLIFGLNEYSAVGAARALQDMGRTDEVAMVGFDSSQEEIALLEEGVFSAIVIQKPFVMGYLGVETSVRLLKGEDLPTQVDSDSEVITKDNMFTEENQKLLFPFWDR